MAHGHVGAFNRGCWECQVWADQFDMAYHTYRSNLPRAGRVAPRSSRIVGVGRHEPDCACRDCYPRGVRFVSWLVEQWWHWTPVGQALYWALAGVVVMLSYL